MKINFFIFVFILFNLSVQAEEVDYSAKFEVALRNYSYNHYPSVEDLSAKWLPELFKRIEIPSTLNRLYIYHAQVSLMLLNELVSKKLVSKEDELLIFTKIAELPYNGVINLNIGFQRIILDYFNTPFFIPMAQKFIDDNKFIEDNNPSNKIYGELYLERLRKKNLLNEKLDISYQPITEILLRQINSKDIYVPFENGDQFVSELIEQIESINTINNESQLKMFWIIRLAQVIFGQESSEFCQQWEDNVFTAMLNLPFKDGEEYSNSIKGMMLLRFPKREIFRELAESMTKADDKDVVQKAYGYLNNLEKSHQ